MEGAAMLKTSSLIFLSCILAACAGIEHVPLSDPQGDVLGIRYYESAPYLLVYSDSKGGIKTQILHLPDQTRMMSARPKSKLASLNTTLVFSNGVLTSSTETVDTSIVPTSILSAIEKVLPLLASSAKRGQEIPAPYLYKIVANADHVAFYGSQGDEPIRIKVTTESGKSASTGGGQ